MKNPENRDNEINILIDLPKTKDEEDNFFVLHITEESLKANKELAKKYNIKD